jgi:hypothetical protein
VHMFIETIVEGQYPVRRATRFFSAVATVLIVLFSVLIPWLRVYASSDDSKEFVQSVLQIRDWPKILRLTQDLNPLLRNLEMEKIKKQRELEMLEDDLFVLTRSIIRKFSTVESGHGSAVHPEEEDYLLTNASMGRLGEATSRLLKSGNRRNHQV